MQADQKFPNAGPDADHSPDAGKMGEPSEPATRMPWSEMLKPSEPAGPVDLTLARPGDVCGYSDGGLGLITQQVDRHDGFQWQSSYGVWHRRNGCSNGRGNGGSDIIAVYRDGRLICGTETEGENQ